MAKTDDKTLCLAMRFQLYYMGIGIGLAISLAIPWLDAPKNVPIANTALLVCVVLWVIGVLLYKSRYGKVDWLAPPVAWAGLYIISSFGRILIDYKVCDRNIKAYLVLVVTGLLGLLLGYYLKAGRGYIKKSRLCRRLHPFENTKLIRQLAAGIMIIGWSLVGFVKIRSFGRYGGYTVYGHGQFIQGPAYYALIAGSLLFVPSVVIYYYLSARRKQKTPLLAVFMIVTYVFFRASSGDRTSALESVIGGLMAHNYALHRIALRRLFLGSVFVVFFVVAIWAYRINRFSVASAGKEMSLLGPRDVVTICLIDFGSAASVGTNLMRWFPEKHEWLYGRSYVDAVFNLIPGFFFGASVNRPFIKAGYLYKDLMEGGRFDPNKSYGFSLLGEAFINFGYCGPFIVLFLLGHLLRGLYDRAFYAQHTHRNWYAIYYIMVYVPLFMALRSDAVGILKQVVYNFIVLAVVLLFSNALKRGLKRRIPNAITRV